MPAASAVPAEALVTLRRRLTALPARHPERTVLMTSTAQLYAVSRATLYRLLRGNRRPKDAHRTDRGQPRSMPTLEIGPCVRKGRPTVISGRAKLETFAALISSNVSCVFSMA